MTDDLEQSNAASFSRYQGSEGLGCEATSALEQGALSGEGIGGVVEESIKQWAEERQSIVSQEI